MESGDGNLMNRSKGEQEPSPDEKDALGKSNGFFGNDVIAKMSVPQRATHYKMDHQRRGIAIVFNHEHFIMSNLKSRTGTQMDCQNFAERLKFLEFDVEVYNDLNYKEMCRVIEKAAEANHSDNDCLLICVMSHGDMGLLYAKDGAYKPDNLWTPFTADKCPTLAGKPKLFFIQACQGDSLDKGVTLSRTETDGQPGHGHSYRIPIHADFLIAYSTVPGFFSWRNTTRGSWFIQALCDELKINQYELDLLTLLTFVSQRVAIDYESFFSWRNTTNGSWFMQALCDELKMNQYELDLLTLLTFVSQRVAIDFESNVPDSSIMHKQKQIPCITSMLTRLVLFNQK